MSLALNKAISYTSHTLRIYKGHTIRVYEVTNKTCDGIAYTPKYNHAIKCLYVIEREHDCKEVKHGSLYIGVDKNKDIDINDIEQQLLQTLKFYIK